MNKINNKEILYIPVGGSVDRVESNALLDNAEALLVFELELQNISHI